MLIVALTGSTTRKYTTASTRTVTLSRVMPSCAGTAIATICMLTFCSRSPTGRIKVSPAPRTAGSTRPNRNTMPCSYCCTILTERPAAISPATASTTRMTTSATITDTSSSMAPWYLAARGGPSRRLLSGYLCSRELAKYF
jgi:hypothetical protein